MVDEWAEREKRNRGWYQKQKKWSEKQRLTASVLVTVVPAIVVSVTLPLGWDAGTLPECTDCTRKVVPPTWALSAALNSCTHTHTQRKRRLELIAHAQVNSGTGIHITTKWFCQIYIITVKYWDRDFYPCLWPPALFLALILTLLSCSLLSMLDKSLRMPPFFVINKNSFFHFNVIFCFITLNSKL